MFKTRRIRVFLNNFRNAIGRSDMIYIIFVLVLTILAGAISFRLLEGWSIWNAIYVTVITLTTVGYGDITPVTPRGRIFATIFTLIAVGIVGYAVSTAAAVLINREQKRLKRGLWERKMQKIAKLKNHIILCGSDAVGRRIAKEFQLAGQPFVIIEPNTNHLHATLLHLQKDNSPKQALDDQLEAYLDDETVSISLQELSDLSDKASIPFLKQDPAQDRTLLDAGIKRAKGLISAFESDKDNIFVVLTARQMAKRHNLANFKIISRVRDEENSNKLKAAGADRVVAPNAIGALQLASEMIRPNTAIFWDRVLHQARRDFRFSIKAIAYQPHFLNKTVDALREEQGLPIVGLLRQGEFYPTLTKDTRVEPGDRLIILSI